MKKTTTRFFAVFADGNFIECKSLEEINRIPVKKWIIKADKFDSHTTGFGSYYEYYSYEIINQNGERDYIQIGDTICLEFGKEERYWGAECVIEPKVVDKNGNVKTISYETRNYNGIEIVKQLVSDMHEINTEDSINAWSIKTEIKNLNK